MSQHHLVWFRRDLRVRDHLALTRACLSGTKVSAIYIDCPGQWQAHAQASQQTDLIQHSLNDLGQSLADMGIKLYQLTVADFSAVPEALSQFVSQHKITAVHAHEELIYNEISRDKSTRARLPVPLHLYQGDTLFAPGEIVNNHGNMYSVFTPFSRQVFKRFTSRLPEPLPAPQRPAESEVQQVSFQPVTIKSDMPLTWPVTEADAHDHLDSFVRDQMLHYADRRDYPAIPGTSYLSPLLAIGRLTARQCIAHVAQQTEQIPASPQSPGYDWVRQLIWREFYRQILIARPAIATGDTFNPAFRQMAWQHKPAEFELWASGNTGYPIIDAAMLCLNQTGWLHNRLRMLVAGFLSKDLLIDWRLGERYMMQQLIDGDFANNNGGWQWSAGTGADAAPWFRIMNPVTQSKKFDSQGQFIRRWLPELAGLDDKDIHWPDASQRRGRYSQPMLDHAKARTQCIAYFKQFKESV